MKGIALASFLIARAAAAATPYDAPIAALRNVGAPEVKELGALVVLPAPELLVHARVAALLNDNQAALELFRHAAGVRNDGYLFSPKVEKFDSKTPFPIFYEHMKLFRLLLLDARAAAARKQPRVAEKDLLAAAGFIVQLSRQESWVMISALVEQQCLRDAYPILSASLRDAASSAAFLKGLAALLDEVESRGDSMQAAFLEEGERTRGSIREGVTPETMARETAKAPLWKRVVVQRLGLMDSEFLSIVKGRLDAALDEQTRMLIGAFRANAPERIDAFIKTREQGILSRKQKRDGFGELAKFKDALKGAPETKRIMADALADGLVGAWNPAYGKLITRYHATYCELTVLQAGLAVRLYEREHHRLPDDLNQLVPGFLSAVPRDPFDGFQPLHYVRKGKRFCVYGFGPNGKDDQGSSVLDLDAYSLDPARDAGDIVYSN